MVTDGALSKQLKGKFINGFVKNLSDWTESVITLAISLSKSVAVLLVMRGHLN